MTRAPWRIFLVTKSFLSKPIGAVSDGVSAGERPSWAAPPAAFAFGRSGWANRRSLAGVAAAAVVAFFALRRCLTAAAAGLPLPLPSPLPAGFFVADAGAFGALSSLSSRRISERLAVRFFGEG